MLKPSYSASDRDSARLVIALHKKAPGAPTALGVFLPPHEVSMCKAMSALTIASLLWSCTTLPASAAWRICGSLYNAYCVVEEKSSRPCGLGLTERSDQTWPDKREACRAAFVMTSKPNELTDQCRAAVRAAQLRRASLFCR